MPVEFAHVRALCEYTEAVLRALQAHGITGADGAPIDHVEVNVHLQDSTAHARNFVLCPGLAYDRSPCGTGTSAKVACLAASGKLAPGEVWRQMGILGTCFDACYQPGERGVLPTISGRAWITAEAQLMLDPHDPFAWGIGADATCQALT